MSVFKIKIIFEFLSKCAYRKLQKIDKGLAMTVIYKYAGPSPSARSPQDDLLVAVDKKTSKILFHQKRAASSDNKKVHIPMVCNNFQFSLSYPGWLQVIEVMPV